MIRKITPISKQSEVIVRDFGTYLVRMATSPSGSEHTAVIRASKFTIPREEIPRFDLRCSLFMATPQQHPRRFHGLGTSGGTRRCPRSNHI